MNWIDNLIDDYCRFIKQKTIISQITNSEWVEISTPFTDVFNDTIDIYAKKIDGKIILSDDGKTLKNLELSGVGFSHSPQRKEILERILITYGIKQQDEELIVYTTEENFPQKKLNLISAISETNDLYVLAKTSIANLFREDVKNYLDGLNLAYTPYFISKGSTGLEFNFDFQIAGRKTELLINTFNSVTMSNLPLFLFTWDDVKQAREKQSAKKVVGLAVINDAGKEIKKEFIEALENKGSDYILWTERNEDRNIQKLRNVA